jgi:hypothetical protein
MPVRNAARDRWRQIVGEKRPVFGDRANLSAERERVCRQRTCGKVDRVLIIERCS